MYHLCTSAVISLILLGAAKGADQVPKTLLVIEPSARFPRNSEGDLIELSDGRLLLAYTRFTGGAADESKADICARISDDAGRTWSEDRVLVANEGRENVMSVSLRRSRAGELLLFYLRKNSFVDCNMYVRRSRDDGVTFGEPVRVTVAPGYHVVNNDRVLRLRDGRLIVPAALHPSTDKRFDEHGIPRVFISDDDGRTWRPDGTRVEPPPKRSVVLQEPGALELRDGRIWMWMRTHSDYQYEVFSTDRGDTWTQPAPSALASPCSPATIERIPWSGHLLAVWNDHSGRHPFPKGKRTPLCVAVSSDEGRTWSPSRAIESSPDGWYCYTSLTWLKDRAILSYCAGDSKVGGLNRLKVLELPRAWIEAAPASRPR